MKATGKAYVPKDYVAKDQKGETLRLWHWCSARRIEYHRGTLHPDRVKQLSALPGWEWTVGENAERDAWTAFDQFVLREGHALVPLSHVEQLNDGDVRLGKWVRSKRRSFAGGFLTPEVIRRFEAAPNWSWNPTEARAERYFLALRQFQKREGHVEVPESHIEDVDGLQMKLGSWVRSMRQKGVKGLLPQETYSALEQFEGWIWDVYQAQFDAGLEAVREFVVFNGHARIPQSATVVLNGSEFAVGSWVAARRADYSKGKLDAEKIAQLESFPGWTWSGKVDTWSRAFEALRDWWTQNDANRVPVTIRHTFRGEEIRIGQWASSQRSQYHAGKLDSKDSASNRYQDEWREDKFERGLNAKAMGQGHGEIPKVTGRMSCERRDFQTWHLGLPAATGIPEAFGRPHSGSRGGQDGCGTRRPLHGTTFTMRYLSMWKRMTACPTGLRHRKRIETWRLGQQGIRAYIRENRLPAEKVQLLEKVPHWQTGNLHETLFNSNVSFEKVCRAAYDYRDQA